MTDSIVTEQVDTNERVFLETDKVKISSVSQPFPQVTGEDVDRVEENLKLNPYLENILEESYPAFCYGGYILKGKELIVSSKNSREVFYEHKDLLNDCYNSIPESESSLKTMVRILMNLYNTGSCNGKGLVLKYFPFNCFVSFDRDISFEEILRIIPVVVLVSEGTAKIHTVNEIREIPLEI